MMKRNKKLITLILLSLLCLGLAVTGSLAAFTKTNYVKRVVATKPGSSEQWSSNYLQPFTSEDDIKEQPFRLGESRSLGVTVCNYPHNDMTKFSSSDISFRLEIMLKDKNGNNVTDSTGSKFYIHVDTQAPEEKTRLSDYDSETRYTLKGGTPSTRLFSFTCNSEDTKDLDGCRLKVKAIPIQPSEINLLAAIFRFTSAERANVSWTGKFVQDQPSPASLDAFNYEISGSEVGTMKLTFNPSKVRISPFSYKELTGIPLTDDISEFTFNVGGEGQPTKYILQFYRTSAITGEATWDDISNYVTYDYPVASGG